MTDHAPAAETDAPAADANDTAADNLILEVNMQLTRDGNVTVTASADGRVPENMVELLISGTLSRVLTRLALKPADAKIRIGLDDDHPAH